MRFAYVEKRQKEMDTCLSPQFVQHPLALGRVQCVCIDKRTSKAVGDDNGLWNT